MVHNRDVVTPSTSNDDIYLTLTANDEKPSSFAVIYLLVAHFFGNVAKATD
ncbi:hypothetical protein PA25_31820 [Pseudoalteromonas sp. A25]|nr:hypothetical protein PA25_31820 [Pseudoalteromonas sp. A25]